jgi:hypothetical protein
MRAVLFVLVAGLTEAQSLKWCLEPDKVLSDCESAADILRNQASNPIDLECVQLPVGAEGTCADYLKNDVFDPFADIATVRSFNQHAAYRKYGLKAILYEDDANTYITSKTAIAIVRRADATITSLGDLEGKNACMTGYGRVTGWQFPLGNMLGSGVIPLLAATTAPNDEESVAGFFNNVCAPGSTRRMCSACKGSCSTVEVMLDDVLIPVDPYAGPSPCS